MDYKFYNQLCIKHEQSENQILNENATEIVIKDGKIQIFDAFFNYIKDNVYYCKDNNIINIELYLHNNALLTLQNSVSKKIIYNITYKDILYSDYIIYSVKQESTFEINTFSIRFFKYSKMNSLILD